MCAAHSIRSRSLPKQAPEQRIPGWSHRSRSPPVTPAGQDSDDAPGVHGFGHAFATGDICAKHLIARRAIFLGFISATVMDVSPDGREPLFGLIACPPVTTCVLLHFQYQ